MKKGLLTTIFLAICISMLMAQIPQAFKYQAVVRDHNGMTIADQNINLRISILFGDPAGNEVYSETHPCNTNALGLVNLEIGRGFNPTTNISDINWAEGNYYIKIEMDESGGSDFEAMGVAQLLSVPYALHSGTAEELRDASGDGVPANNWILFGNRNTDPTEDKLGTTDAADLVIVTDDIERMRVLSDGDVHIVNSAEVGLNLTVKENVNLNTFAGETKNHGPFTVTNLSPTLLSGILTVDLHTDLNSSLNVDGVTDLNSALNVNNVSPTLLTGTLLVNENATFNQHVRLDNASLQSLSPSTGGLVVDGGTGIGRDLWVGGSAHFDGPLRVNCDYQSESTITGALTVVGGVGIGKRVHIGGASVIDTLDVNGQLTVTGNPGVGSQHEYNDYPLLVEGGSQGIAIKVKDGRDKTNNYVSFWDEDSGDMWGRIEGQTLGDLWTDPEFHLEHGFMVADVILSGAEVLIAIGDAIQAGVDFAAASSSSTACGGLGACVTAPIPSFIIAGGIGLISAIANGFLAAANLVVSLGEEANFLAWRNANIGVSYQSGAGDYAEWLPKENPSESFAAGELVGVRNGFVTKNTWGVENIMIVSTNPIILGNMPLQNDEVNNVKIAFMGQVPVKVLGDVRPGDYIIPSEFGSGFGKAVNPADMKTSDYKNIAGVAWNVMSQVAPGINMVNVAVGINSNDLSDVVQKQEEELASIKTQMTELNNILASLVPGFADAAGVDANAEIPENTNSDAHVGHQDSEYHIAYSNEEDILYFEISREQIETSIEMAREQYQLLLDNASLVTNILFDEEATPYLNSDGVYLVPIDQHPFWKKIDSDPTYKEEIIQYVKTSLESAMHTHKKHAHKFTDLQLHE